MTIEEQFNEILEGSDYTWRELGLLDFAATPLSQEEFEALGKGDLNYRLLW